MRPAYAVLIVVDPVEGVKFRNFKDRAHFPPFQMDFTHLESVGDQLDFRTPINIKNGWIFLSVSVAVRPKNHSMKSVTRGDHMAE